MPTEILKFRKLFPSDFEVMKASTSECVTFRIPMLAPRRLPACFTYSVAVSYIFIKAIAPAEEPSDEVMISSLGRSFEKL